MKATYDDQEVHFFASSFLNWSTGSDLAKTLRRQKRVDHESSSLQPKGFNLWRVPGPEDSEYRIDNYSPSVEGAEFIAYLEY